MKRRIRVTVAVVLTLTLLAGTVASYADIAANQAKLNSINQQISVAKSQLNQAKSEVSSLTREINSLNSQIAATQSSINQTEAQIKQTTADIEVKVGELDNKSQEIVKQNIDLNDRLVAMYKNGEAGYLEVLLGSKSFTELLDNIDMISRIYTQDEDFMDLLQDQYDDLAGTKRELEALNVQLEQQKVQLEAQKSALASQKSQVQALKAEAQNNVQVQSELLDGLNESAASITTLIVAEQKAEAERKAAAEKAAAEKKAAEAEAAAQKAQAAASSTTSTSVSVSSGSRPNYTTSSTSKTSFSGGRFIIPAPSYTRVSSGYGYRIHPIYKTRKLHTGIDFSAPANTACVAAGSGTVIYAGWYGGYGNAVVIDHGGGVCTLYGHNNSVIVSKGQQVSQGQQIAYIGSTGNSTGPHCHFEVRINGSCVDPSPYLGG